MDPRQNAYTHQLGGGAAAYIQPPGSWWLSNAGILTGAAGAALVDTAATETRMNGLLAAVAAETKAPIEQIVLTHAHGDHANGISLVPTAKVSASARCRDELAAGQYDRWNALFPTICWGKATAGVPDTAVTEPVTMDLAGHKAHILPLSVPAHTSGDLTVFLPALGTLFAGDLVWNGVAPLAAFGSIAGWLGELDVLMALDPAVVIPGHGAPGGPELIEETASYLRWVQNAAEQAVQSNLTPAAAVAAFSTRAPSGWIDAERLVVNIRRGMAEITGEPIDLMAGITDLVTAYGGAIPTDA
jgi:cyclase